MDAKESQFIARKYIKENIYGLAKMELPHITFPQTEEILENSKLSGVTSETVLTVINIRNAWNFILDSFDDEITKATVMMMHAKIAYDQAMDWGVFCTGQVGVSGTNYTPVNPREEPGKLESLFDEIFAKFTTYKEQFPIEATLDYLTSAIKNQFFWDGNKQTALAVANLALLQSGNGVIGLDEDNFQAVSTALTQYYNTDDKRPLVDVLYRKCIKTYHFEPSNHFDFDSYLSAIEGGHQNGS
jgi:prophage maintenance system killer protein